MYVCMCVCVCVCVCTLARIIGEIIAMYAAGNPISMITCERVHLYKRWCSSMTLMAKDAISASPRPNAKTHPFRFSCSRNFSGNVWVDGAAVDLERLHRTILKIFRWDTHRRQCPMLPRFKRVIFLHSWIGTSKIVWQRDRHGMTNQYTATGRRVQNSLNAIATEVHLFGIDREKNQFVWIWIEQFDALSC